MADATATTSFGATEVLQKDILTTPTFISSAFAALLDALSRHALAERGIEDVDIWDLAFCHWLTEAEQVFTEVTTLIGVIRRADPARVEDRVLQRLTTLIDAMIGSEEPGTFQRLHARLPVALFRCPGEGPAALQARWMLAAARRRIDALAQLATYADLPPEEGPESAFDARALPLTA
ncbi:MAG TPA: hypothetical protein PLI13_09310 [Paracoccus sp. (in: a-proteobacteria)]|nr:hypothetical protein [Paracoccus sp. (in: a-proteobacteria)]